MNMYVITLSLVSRENFEFMKLINSPVALEKLRILN